MRIAIISLPQVNTPVQGIMTNLNGWWAHPEILEQWAGGCKVEYDSEFPSRENRVLISYCQCMAQFYRENAL